MRGTPPILRVAAAAATRARRGVATAVTVALLTLALPAAAAAWLPPADVSSLSGGAAAPFHLAVAVAPDGTATAAWASSGTWTATRDPHGVWQSAQRISSSGVIAAHPQVAVDAVGNVTVVWRWSDADGHGIDAAHRPASGPWEDPVTLASAPTGHFHSEPELAVDAAGRAVAAWWRESGETGVIEAAVRSADGSWAPPQELAEPGDLSDPHVAIGGGVAVAAWDTYDADADRLTAHTSARDGAAWTAPEPLATPGPDSLDPQVGVDANGTATALWARDNGTGLAVESSTRPPGGPWGAPAQVSAPTAIADELDLAVNPAGAAVAAWRVFGNEHDSLQAAIRPAGTAWGPPTDLPSPWPAEPKVALEADGDAIVLWCGGAWASALHAPVHAVSYRAGVWGNPIEVSGADEVASAAAVALDPAGKAATAVWLNGSLSVRSAIRDIESPQLRDLVVPATARFGLAAGRARSGLSALAQVRVKLRPRSRKSLRRLARLRRQVPVRLTAAVRLDTPAQAAPLATAPSAASAPPPRGACGSGRREPPPTATSSGSPSAYELSYASPVE